MGQEEPYGAGDRAAESEGQPGGIAERTRILVPRTSDLQQERLAAGGWKPPPHHQSVLEEHRVLKTQASAFAWAVAGAWMRARLGAHAYVWRSLPIVAPSVCSGQ